MSMARAGGTTGQDQQNDVLALLTEQCVLCRELSGLGERQRSLVTANQPEELLQVLGQRQGVIDRLAALSDRMRPYQQDWPRVRSRLSQEAGQAADRMVAEVNSHLARILEGDKTDAEHLASRRQATSADMTRLKTTRLAGAAYAASQQDSMTSRVEWTDE